MWKPLDGTADKTVKGARQAPDLCATVTAWPRQRRNSKPPIRSRTNHTTQAIRDTLLQVAAEFSGCVSSCSLEQRSLPPYCVRTDLVQNQRETGFRL